MLMRSKLVETYVCFVSDQAEVTPHGKKEALDNINKELRTAYAITDINSWLAKRREAPTRAKDFMRRELLVRYYGKNTGRSLSKLLELE